MTQAASLLGGLVGPALGGLLADMAGLRAPFTLTGCAALAAAAYGWIRLPETMGTRKEQPERSASAGTTVEEAMVRCLHSKIGIADCRASLPLKCAHAYFRSFRYQHLPSASPCTLR